MSLTVCKLTNNSIEFFRLFSILTYTNEAIENEKLGKKLATVKKETILSDFFQKELGADLELKIF